MTNLKLWCGIYSEGGIFPVEIELNARVIDLKRVIISSAKLNIPSRWLSLSLARDQSGTWWKKDDNTKKLLQGRPDINHTQMRSTYKLNDSEYFGHDFKPNDGEIQVLVKITPLPEDTTIADMQAGGCKFSQRSPKRFLKSDAIGADWDFQNPPGLDEIAPAVRKHYTGWSHGYTNQCTHPLFLCLDDPGTGKSRLLDEFPKILKSQICQPGEDEELVGLVKNAFTFKIKFDNDMSLEGDTFTYPGLAIGARMLFQLQESLPWDEFKTCPAHHVVPSDVFSLLAQLRGTYVDKMCVILCVDGLQDLDLVQFRNV